MKQVRIDHRTVIEVNDKISDERARKEYLGKLKTMKVESPYKGHRSKGGTRHKDIPRHDIVFRSDNISRVKQNKAR